MKCFSNNMSEFHCWICLCLSLFWSNCWKFVNLTERQVGWGCFYGGLSKRGSIKVYQMDADDGGAWLNANILHSILNEFLVKINILKPGIYLTHPLPYFCVADLPVPNYIIRLDISLWIHSIPLMWREIWYKHSFQHLSQQYSFPHNMLVFKSFEEQMFHESFI